MLDRGGNAVDAAVAAAFAAGVVGPYHNGLAGGGFALVALQGKETLALDFREVAPAAATRDMYLRDGKPVPELSIDGALSVAVPNAVNGYLALLERAGSLPRSVVLGPAIRLARDGFVVNPKYRQTATDRLAVPAARRRRRAHLSPAGSGRPPRRARPRRAHPPARAGPHARAHRRRRRRRRPERTHRPRHRADGPRRGRHPHRGRPRSASGPGGERHSGAATAGTPSPPFLRRPGAGSSCSRRSASSSGCVRSASSGAPRPACTSTSRRSAGRTSTGPWWWPTRTRWTCPSPGSSRRSTWPRSPRASTRPGHALGLAPPAGPTSALRPALPPRRSTPPRFSVIDRAGNAVALTTTLNTWFGSCLVARGTGLLLNDEMDDFSIRPGVPNSYGLVFGEAQRHRPGEGPGLVDGSHPRLPEGPARAGAARPRRLRRLVHPHRRHPGDDERHRRAG